MRTTRKVMISKSEVSSKMEHTTRHGAVEGKMQTGLVNRYANELAQASS